ncbi:MAG: hypothetical protein PHD40_08980 [Syntrophomonadaceae bacterium]|nr:hypothetical protein [Syntrophomonadaceae bacterium]
MVKKQLLGLSLLLVLSFFMIGCEQVDFSKLAVPSTKEQAQFIKVEIFFTDGVTLIGYIKNLGIEPEGKVYVGGSSTNYLYDARGKVVGAYNYQRVLYIKIIPENQPEPDTD